MRHPKSTPHTVLIVWNCGGVDLFAETERGYSEAQALADILAGEYEDIQQVLLMTRAGCEDITSRMAERVMRAIEWEPEPNEHASRFAEDFAGYEPPRPLDDDFWERVDYAHDRAN